MINTKKVFMVILTGMLLIITSVNCFKDDNECDKCYRAVQHMADKIEANGCNPNTMQTAYNRIKEDCDIFRFIDARVGIIAETCNTDKPVFVTPCNTNTPSLNLAEHNIKIIVIFEDNTNANVEIILNITGSQIQTYEAISYQTVEWPYLVEELSLVIVSVQDGITKDLISANTHDFTFNRPNNWHATRVIRISKITEEDSYNIEFENF